MSETVKCRNCPEPVRRVQPGEGIDPRDFAWVHEDGNPLCGVNPAYADPEDGDFRAQPPAEGSGPVTISGADFSALLAVATMYVNAFSEDEMMTLPEKLRLQEIEAILERHGRRY
jgi:hypothetical protein